MGGVKDKATGLTEQEVKFCHLFITWRNATKAAREAGYSPRSAYQLGSKLLKKVEIQEYLNVLRAERNERLCIDADDVLKELLELLDTDQAEIFEELRDDKGNFVMDDDGYVKRTMNVKNISQWPSALRKHVLSYDVQEDEISGTKITKVKFPSKREVLKMIGDHTRVQAFVTKIEVKDVTDTADVLQAARKRHNASMNIEPSAN